MRRKVNISTLMNQRREEEYTGPLRRGGQPGRRPGAHEFKQVESYCLNHNSSIHFCCTDSLLMTHRGGLSCVSLFGELEEGGKFAFVLEPKNSLGSPVNMSII